MHTGEIEYHAPESLEEAVALLAEHGPAAAPLGGGTDILPALKFGVFGARHLVSLKRIATLRDIAGSEGHEVSIGALVTLRDVAESSAVRQACQGLAEAAAQAGSPLLRNRGTLGGNICLDTRCWYYNQSEAWRASRALCQKAGGEQCYVNQKQNRCVALFSADTPAALIAAGARATLVGPDGARTVSVEALYSGDGLRPITRAAGELLTAVAVPVSPARSGTAYVKHSVRESIDFPIVGVGAAVTLRTDDRLAEARVAITGVGTAPVRSLEIEEALRGRPVPPDGDSVLADIVSRALGPLFLTDTVPHKRWLAGFMAVEAVRRAAARAGAGRPS